jgi:hypothetical protein
MKAQKILVFAAALSAIAMAPALAQTEYDGRWSVRVVAQTETCSDNFSIALNVDDGRITYGGIFARANGNVSDSGNLNVRVSSGGNVVKAAGALEERTGSGTWNSPSCEGVWTAVKVA